MENLENHGILKSNFQALEKLWKCVGLFEISFICILIFKHKWMNNAAYIFIQTDRSGLRSWELTHRAFYAATTAFLQMQAMKVQKYLGNAGSKMCGLLWINKYNASCMFMPEHVIFGHGKLAKSYGKPWVKICLMHFSRHVNKMLKKRAVLEWGSAHLWQSIYLIWLQQQSNHSSH